MNIISFTMVNNESEIIESFIRYNSNFVDEMVIIDNGCTDNTITIVNYLKKEGYNITVYDESLEAYNQFRLDNKYLRKIIHEKNADIIIPLDADEFLIGMEKNPRTILEGLSLDRVYYVNWQWYVMTEQDDKEENFIPRRMKYCLKKPAWNYSDGTPVTKAIIPAKYFDKMNLTMAMGHHTVFGNDKAIIEELPDIRFAHYRAISEEQLVYKTSCYTMRDIATMENNFETAQRTNQMAVIESGVSMWEAAVEASYGGYTKDIEHNPIDLQYCDHRTADMKYSQYARETLAQRVMKTGREMAIRAYNIERQKKEKKFLKPIVMWMDGIKGEECIFPNPSNRITILTEKYNVRAYLTLVPEIRYLKANYRLMVTPDVVKFIPYQYIVIPDTVDVYEVKKQMMGAGIESSKIVTLKEYRKKLGIFKRVYSNITFLPSMIKRVLAYFKRNGFRTTISKVKSRLSK